MIKIHDKLWYVARINSSSLSYMTYFGKDKAFEKRKLTGTSWANNTEGKVCDNSPVKGVKIGESVCRWSTSNKLFRVEDPRGFTIEVPTGNIATLLHLTTVTNGVIQEECVWGREGSNHILLPVNSEPYKEAIKDMDTLENKLLTWKDIKVGDWVKLFKDDVEYYYAGKAKMMWKVSNYEAGSCNYWGHSARRPMTLISPEEREDPKWVHILVEVYKAPHPKGWGLCETASPKIVEVLRNKEVKISLTDIYMCCPSRVDTYQDYYSEAEVIGGRWK